MLADGSPQIFLTFLLAIIGYFGLTITLLYSVKKKFPLLFWRIIASIILVHVIMVWTFRYNWQLSLAIRNGYIGFIIFHSALLIILYSTLVKENAAIPRKWLIKIAFIIVTIGALGASFRYEVVEIYRVPVILCALAGSIGLSWSYIKQYSQR